MPAWRASASCSQLRLASLRQELGQFPGRQIQSTYLQTNQFNGTEANTSLKQDRIVPILDFELGLAWVSPREHVRISAGYLVSAWFNTITSESWIDSVQNGSFQPGQHTITFDGLTARAEVRF